MPIPNRKSGESENQFISRCMSAIGDEYSQEQALGICYSKFRENMSKEGKVISRINQMNRYQEQKKQEELIEPNPCWSGYIAIGTKIVDGKEVPNCVPED